MADGDRLSRSFLARFRFASITDKLDLRLILLENHFLVHYKKARINY